MIPKPQPISDSVAIAELQLYVEKDTSTAHSVDGLPQELVDTFAAATGWELARVGNEIKIVDMSADWPAKTPTAHRAKCDRLAAAISELL